MTAVADPVVDLEGAGVVSSWAELAATLTADRIDPDGLAFAAADAGLDALGAVLHPFDALLRAGLGWIVEHVAFLREPLDALAGEPAEVLAQARHWDGVAGELRAAAAALRAADPPGWEGAAATSYRQAAAELVAAMSAGAEQAGALSRLILVAGATVGTVRVVVRDAVAEFAATVVQYLLAAGTLAFLTAGGSLASVVLTVVVRAVEVAESIVRRIRQLVDLLAEAGGAAGRIGVALRHAADRIRAAEPGLRTAGAALLRQADTALTPVVVESGTQLTAARQDRDAWRESDR